MSRITNLTRTTALRLSALYVLLFAIVALVLSAYMSNLSVSMLTNETQKALQEELVSVEDAYQHGGLPRLMRTIDKRSYQPGAFLYLVADPSGRILAGNVASIETGMLRNEGMIPEAFSYERYGENNIRTRHKAIATVVNLPNGMKLLVGRDLGEPERFVAIIRKALLIAFMIMAVGAFLIWFFVGRTALQRIDKVSEASQTLMEGDLSGRLPISGSGDEFDRLSQNLNQMLERMEEMNTGLRQVSDNIAHDLKTPLTRLRNRAEDALSGKKKTADYREAIEGVIMEADQLIRTFNAILMISRIEASSALDQLEVQNIRPVVEDIAELYEPVAEEAGVTLKLGGTFDADLRLNRELAAQSIFNLLDNAIKYAIKEGETAQVTLSLEQGPDEIRIVVSDNGPGIPEESREKAMERFARLEESRTQPGFGIGLSLAKAVMKLHGGTLRLEDANPGLRAVLAFPVMKKH